MSFRDKIYQGSYRPFLTMLFPVIVAAGCFFLMPTDATEREKILNGLQKVAFVAGAFAVTAYNLRTRVVDLVLKTTGSPTRVAQFCLIARGCGKRLTNLVLIFTVTSAWLAALTLTEKSPFWSKFAVSIGVGLLVSSFVSFVYIIFSFERLERFALDDAEKFAREKEADRLFNTRGDKTEEG